MADPAFPLVSVCSGVGMLDLGTELALEPGFRVLVDGVAVALDAARVDQLRCGGNGVVALQAAVAFAHLLRSFRDG